MQYNGTEMCEELSTGHSRVEIRKLIAAKQPPSASTRSFIPVNMRRFLWKGLIWRLFRGIMSGSYRLPISGDKGVAHKARKKWKKRRLCVFWTLIVLSGRKNEWWGFWVRLVSQIFVGCRLTWLNHMSFGLPQIWSFAPLSTICIYLFFFHFFGSWYADIFLKITLKKYRLFQKW